MTFQQKLDKIINKNNSLVCVGLDTDIDKIPLHIRNGEHPQSTFNKVIIDVTADLVCAYKPNTAFYEQRGKGGIEALKMTCDYLREKYPEIVIIIDAKRADIGNTNEGYVKFIFDYLGADAVTLHPYLGKEALMPFLNQKDKGCIILCRTSNKGAGEFQDLRVILGNEVTPESDSGPIKISEDFQGKQARMTKGEPLYKIVAKKVTNEWNFNNNCLLVVGATYPGELAEVRKIAGDMTFLVPGIGAQGGDVEKTVKAGLNSKKSGMVINSSRGIIFASDGNDFAKRARKEAKKLRDEINKYRV